MREHIGAQIGDHALANGDDKEVARGRGQSEHADDADHGPEIPVDGARALRREAMVDHAFHGERHGQRGSGSNTQRGDSGQDTARIAPRVRHEGQQSPQRSALGVDLLWLGHVLSNPFWTGGSPADPYTLSRTRACVIGAQPRHREAF